MKLTPITELHPATCNLAQTIPDYASPERIGLNMDNLGRVAAWGGFHRDNIVITGFDGERSSVNTSVVGFGEDGTAVAGATSAKIADLGSGEPSDRDPAWRTRSNLRLSVNTTELFDRMNDSSVNVREPGNWSKHINTALAMGLREAAWKNLIAKPLPVAEVKYTLAGSALQTCYSLLAQLAIDDNFSVDPAQSTRSAIVGAVLAPNVIKAIEWRKKACFSLVPVFHFDRLAMVGGLSRMLRFAKVIPADHRW